jgi:hypothetical protein
MPTTRTLQGFPALFGCALWALHATAAPAAPDSSADAWQAAAPPAGSVAIYRDDWGVPHVHAAREEDGYFGLGYAVAQDDLEDVLRQIAIGRGETARYFGPRFIEADRMYALFDVRAESAAGLRRLPEHVRRNLDAYIAGLNRYLKDHPGERPAWASGLEPATSDLVGFTNLFIELFPVNAIQGIGDCQRGGVKVSSTLELFNELLKTGGPGDASTAWAVAPRRTAAGVAIHLADPHTVLNIPSPEFRMHAGDLELSGFTTNALFIAHTRHVAWGSTFGSPDVADCYALELQADDPFAYQAAGGRGQIHRRTVTVQVKGEAARPLTIEWTTLNGLRAPIVAHEGQKAHAVVSPYLVGAERAYVDLDGMAHASNLGQFAKALSAEGFFPVGLTAADSEGAIGHYRIGRTPVRDDAIDWSRPVDPADPRTAWRGVHAFGDLVQVTDPEAGYVRETNMSPASMWGGDNPFHTPPYPRYVIGDLFGAGGYQRGRRADDMLSAAYALTEDEAKALAADDRWAFVPEWQAGLRAALGGDPRLSASERRLAQRILWFDGVASKDSVPALGFHYWHDGVAEAGRGQAFMAALPHKVETRAALDGAEKALLVQGLRLAAARLDRLGPGDSTHGDVFRIGRGGETYPLGGCSTAFTVALHTYYCGPGDKERLAVSGQKSVMLTVFSRPLRSYSLSAFGQDWRAGSHGLHVNDQSKLASDGRMKPTYFDYADLMATHPSKLLLKR